MTKQEHLKRIDDIDRMKKNLVKVNSELIAWLRIVILNNEKLENLDVNEVESPVYWEIVNKGNRLNTTINNLRLEKKQIFSCINFAEKKLNEDLKDSTNG